MPNVQNIHNLTITNNNKTISYNIPSGTATSQFLYVIYGH